MSFFSHGRSVGREHPSRLRTLRRGLAAGSVAIALPAALTTSPAAAYNIAAEPPTAAQCLYAGRTYSEDSIMRQAGVRMRCNDGGEWETYNAQ
jgi:hypothetical protein